MSVPESVRILWSFARPHRRVLALGLLLALAGSALGLASPMRAGGSAHGGFGGGAVLELRGVTAAYGPGLDPAVRGIDLAVQRRGHLAIVGPSGAGRRRSCH
ncbi:hypothetical protein OG946_33630 [Streptomyces sp. NBC_01808]|uniref:hypothetical protein n=1 Tax=Streptomyces sp. NBC_01808 TaxID=2975947 RepID=UPI002DD8AD73|nr:hypothetical protein [Streptomyces sp. NBC_01808]WSA42732.1 hypothetical protein OG946_33630 [Streptomyces sp. NBC_01808]